MVPAGLEITLYRGLGDLPHFNPDMDTAEPPETVTALRREVGHSDALLIAVQSMRMAFPALSKMPWIGWSVALNFQISPLL